MRLYKSLFSIIIILKLTTGYSFSAEPRQLGIGLEEPLLVYLDESHQGLTYQLSTKKIAEIRAWINDDQRKNSILDILDGNALAKTIPDLLIDMDITDLTRILPALMADLSESEIQLLLGENLYDSLDIDFVNALTATFSNEDIKEDLNNLLSNKNKLLKLTPQDPDSYLLAYLIPPILQKMDNEKLQKISRAIAQRLAPKNFEPLADSHYFDLKLISHEHAIKVQNSGRVLIFRPIDEQDPPSVAIFRNKVWRLDNSHIHLVDGVNLEREHLIYETRQQADEIKKGMRKDPNDQIIGEIHTVYKRTTEQGERYIGVVSPLIIGSNGDPDLQDVLNRLADQEPPLAQDIELKSRKNFQKIFMKNLSLEEPLHGNPWTAKSNSNAINSGIVYLFAKPITISQTQYDRLRALFGEGIPVPKDKILRAIPRRP